MRGLFPAVVVVAALSSPVPALAGSESASQQTTGPTTQQPDETDAAEQIDIGDLIARVFRRDRPAPNADEAAEALAETRLILLPTFGGNPAVGVAVGVLGTLTNYWGDPADTSLSAMVMSASVTTRKQLLVAGRSDFYTPRNQFRLAGDWRLYIFKERTHGLGSDSTADLAADIDYN